MQPPLQVKRRPEQRESKYFGSRHSPSFQPSCKRAWHGCIAWLVSNNEVLRVQPNAAPLASVVENVYYVLERNAMYVNIVTGGNVRSHMNTRCWPDYLHQFLTSRWAIQTPPIIYWTPTNRALHGRVRRGGIVPYPGVHGPPESHQRGLLMGKTDA
jgi:hypothetical protein